MMYRAKRCDNGEDILCTFIMTLEINGKTGYYAKATNENYTAKVNFKTGNVFELQGNFYKITPESIECLGWK